MKLETAITIMGAHNAQAVGVPLAQRYSPDLLLVLPMHINLFYPFVPFDAIDSACQKLRAIGSKIAPFEITLRGYGQFERVTYMVPADPAPILDVFHRIFMEFPDYPPYRGKFGNDLIPHMTVAIFKDEHSQQNADLPDYGSLSFTVDRLHVIYGPARQDRPWLTYDVIPLL